MVEEKQINVKDWITLSTVMIGAVLTILALIWDPSILGGGRVTATFMLLLAFILFVNSVSTNSKANFEVKAGKTSEAKINQWIRFAEYTFGLAFTFVICGFALLGYNFLLVYVGRELITLLMPIILICVALILMIIYNIINYDGVFSAFKNLKRNIWMILEIVFIILIILDFAEIILIP